ncbi:MAG: TetR/AcrR family transcriptional regulator [Lentisphaeraceae bacterium]|nr:TetR/AcrR family transcriptional regulator [Lentisphaeraceae bacterium]
MGRNKTYKKDEVLEKALELFWRKGYEGTHLQDLVTHTGLNRFSLYKEFGGKDGLFHEVFELYVGRVTGFLSVLTKEPQGLSTIIKFFKSLNVSFFLHGCFLINSLSEKFLIQEKTYQKALDWTKKFDQALEMNLKISRDSGEIRDDITNESIKNFLIALDSGIAVMAINHPQKDVDMVVTLIDVFLQSLKK